MAKAAGKAANPFAKKAAAGGKTPPAMKKAMGAKRPMVGATKNTYGKGMVAPPARKAK